jgi:hypothetical protein
MAYSTVFNTADGDPFAAAAFMNDSADIISLDPEKDDAVDSVLAQFNKKIEKARATKGSELDPDEVMEACMANSTSFNEPIQRHRTDDEAYQAIHEVRGTFDRINRVVSPNG